MFLLGCIVCVKSDNTFQIIHLNLDCWALANQHSGFNAHLQKRLEEKNSFLQLFQPEMDYKGQLYGLEGCIRKYQVLSAQFSALHRVPSTLLSAVCAALTALCTQCSVDPSRAAASSVLDDVNASMHRQYINAMRRLLQKNIY